ncbi:unnamed protein product [Parascedosporium putredinis]|uniref:Uncharacterized protein n=1 Tax=Parascedosporium putredinis TaxID=1442378 RepID=A0A9P1GXU5_9PEZI|nr:unnamed protein product [Parascedosporium putredinis]CAI7990142.1 unnamed protein product [Parascedosporium putredinis]
MLVQDLERLVRWSKNRLIEMLTDASTDTKAIALQRETASILETDLRQNPKAILFFLSGKGPVGHVQKKLLEWYARAEDKARLRVSYETSSTAAHSIYIDRMVAFETLLTRWALKEQSFLVWADDNFEGERTVWEASPQVERLTTTIKDHAHEWFLRHVITPEFLANSPIQLMDMFLRERPDMMVLANLVLNLPKSKYTQEIEMHRNEAEQIRGGRDLAGYRLTNLERAVLAATVLLPAAGRLFRHGRAVYSEVRLARMYGRSEAQWTKTITDALLKKGNVDAPLAKELEAVLPQVAHAAAAPATATAVTSTVAPEVKTLWQTLSDALPILKVLDEFAIERIIRKGSNESHIKGQLLEEIMEAHIIPWLRKREAGFALGVAVPEGKTLEYIPGHTILSASERAPSQVTDGMIGYWDKDVFHILGIFEVKAGKRALSKPIQRGRNPASVFIDGKLTQVHMSPQSTKFFGIVTKGRRVDHLETQVTAAGFKFEAIAAPITNAELNSATKRLAELGAATVPKPP